jgi:hypothetical protein
MVHLKNNPTMRICSIILIFLTSISLYGQNDKTVVYGNVISPIKDFWPFSYSGITYKEYKPDGNWSLSSISVDKDGKFSY